MSTPASAQADQKRPPGPHNQNVKLVTQIESPNNSDKQSPNSIDISSSKDPTHQRLVLTDPVAFRFVCHQL